MWVCSNRIRIIGEKKNFETNNVIFDGNKKKVDAISNLKGQNYTFSRLDFPENGDIFHMIVDFIESRNRSDSSWNTRETGIQSIDNPRKTRSSKFRQSLSDSTDLIPYTYILIGYVVQFLIKLDLGHILTLRKLKLIWDL